MLLYEDFGKIRVWVNFLLNLGIFTVYCCLICRYQIAKSNTKVGFPVHVSCNTAIIIWSLLIPSFVIGSNSKFVESLLQQNESLRYS